MLVSPAPRVRTTAPSNPPPRRVQADPSRLWRVLGLPSQRAAPPRPIFGPASCGSFHDIAGLFVGPDERVLVVCVDPTAATAATAAGQGAAEVATRALTPRDDRRLGLLLEAVGLVVDAAVDGEPAAAGDPGPLLAFLGGVDRAVPDELEVHLILDRRASVRARAVQEWFRARPRYHVHFARDLGRWQERALTWLRFAAARQERWNAPRSTLALEAALHRFVLRPPAAGRAFGWSRSADEHLTNLARFLLHRRRAH